MLYSRAGGILRVWSGCADRIPAAISVLLPSVIGFLVDVAVLSSVHIPGATLSHESTTILSAPGDDSAAFRRARSGNGAARVGVMSRLSPLVAFGDDGAAPLAIGIRSLTRGAVGPGVGIVGASRTGASIGAARADRPSVGSPRGVVPSAARDSAVWAIGSTRIPIGAVIWVVECAHAVSYRVWSINRVGIRPVVVVRGIVVSAAVGDRRAYSRSNDENAKVPGGAARFDFTARGRGLRNIGDAVNRGTRRNDFLYVRPVRLVGQVRHRLGQLRRSLTP
jgi:hypothetical protein